MKKTYFLTVLLSSALALNAQTFVDTTPASFVQNLDFPSSAVGDINGDGKLDIVVTGENSADGTTSTYVYINNGKGFDLATNTGIDRGVKWSCIDLGDYDHDGFLDIVMQGWDDISGTDTQKCYIYHNNGSGTFTKTAELQGRSNGTVEWGDYDNDGKLDLLQTGWQASVSDGRTALYHNDGNNVFTPISHAVTGVADGHAHWGDYDKDGKLDIIIAGWNKTQIYKGNGTGGFSQTTFSLSQNHDFTWCNWVDYNKDGILDIVVAGLIPGSSPAAWETKVYTGLSNGLYEDSYIDLPGVQRGPVLLGDCNKDGKLDFFIAGWNGAGAFQICKNDGTNQVYDPITGINSVITGWADGTMQVKDFNGDGYDEIFKCGWNITGLYSNTARPSAVQKVLYSNVSITQSYKNLIIDTKENMGQYKVEIFEMTGKTVFSNQFTETSVSLPISNLSKGYYLVRVLNNEMYKKEIIWIK